MRRSGVLLDRDGTLIVERHYLSDPGGVELFPGAAAAVARLNRAGWPVAVVTNQSGIGRGYFDEGAMQGVHRRIDALLAAEGARIDLWLHCPHSPEAGGEDCICRKPQPGMGLEAVARLDLDPGRSYVVGDKAADIGLARAIGAGAILVRTGYGEEAVARFAGDPGVFVARDLADAVQWILAGNSGAAGPVSGE